MRQRHLDRRNRQRLHRGLVLLAFLIAIAVGGILLMLAVDVWWLARQRAREEELLFIGDQYRRAIQRYFFAAPPGSVRVLPGRFDDLLEDDRFPMPVHHLRRLYRDPITGNAEWGLVRLNDRLAGVYSLSEKAPVKRAGFPTDDEAFKGAASYQDWVFAVTASGQVSAPVPASVPSPGSTVSPDLPALLGRHPS